MSEVEGDKPSFNSIIDNASNLISLKLKKHVSDILYCMYETKSIYYVNDLKLIDTGSFITPSLTPISQNARRTDKTWYDAMLLLLVTIQITTLNK